jgi:hypothetical protein
VHVGAEVNVASGLSSSGSPSSPPGSPTRDEESGHERVVDRVDDGDLLRLGVSTANLQQWHGARRECSHREAWGARDLWRDTAIHIVPIQRAWGWHTICNPDGQTARVDTARTCPRYGFSSVVTAASMTVELAAAWPSSASSISRWARIAPNPAATWAAQLGIWS